MGSPGAAVSRTTTVLTTSICSAFSTIRELCVCVFVCVREYTHVPLCVSANVLVGQGAVVQNNSPNSRFTTYCAGHAVSNETGSELQK